MRFWFDTEFYENGRTIELISIGIVGEDGREYYAEVAGADLVASSTEWLAKNVAPHLGPIDWQRPRTTIKRDILTFVGDKPEFWAYYADYDWVVLCQLFGTMMDLPAGWPMFCLDVKQLAHMRGVNKIDVPHVAEHDALADARWTRDAWLLLETDTFRESRP